MSAGRAVLLATTILVLAGCAGGGGPSRVVASGTPAQVGDDALAATGYERASSTNRTLNTTVQASISGDVKLEGRRDVTATTPIATYRRATDAGPALFAVATAPAVRPIENQPVARNPLTADGTAALVAYIQSTYAVESLEQTDNGTVTMLGNETYLERYQGTVTREGSAASVTVFVATVRDGTEFVTAVAVAPTDHADRDRVVRLLGGVAH